MEGFLGLLAVLGGTVLFCIVMILLALTMKLLAKIFDE